MKRFDLEKRIEELEGFVMMARILSFVTLLWLLGLVFVGLTVLGCTNSKEELAQSAEIRMAEAVNIAEASVPGIAITAEITQKEGAPAYLVEVLDVGGTEHVAYVNARNGQTVEIDGDAYAIQEVPQGERTLQPK